MIVYDLEIQKAIPHGERVDGIEYCKGWDDHANMGIACLCAYDFAADRYFVFTEDNLKEFDDLAEGHTLGGFNSIGFDNKVLRAEGLLQDHHAHYDLLRRTWDAMDDIDPDESKKGSGLDALARANGFKGKTGHGAKAPVWYQQGQIGRVINYCLEDVRITKELIARVYAEGVLNDPRKPSRQLEIAA